MKDAFEEVFGDKKKKALHQHVNGLNQEEIDNFMKEIEHNIGSFEILRWVATD